MRRLREGNAQGLAEWEEFARARWSTALGQREVSGPSTFIRRVEEGLAQVRGDLRSSRRSHRGSARPCALLRRDRARRRAAAPPCSRCGGSPGATTGIATRSRSTCASPPCPCPAPPDKRLYELKVQSRYGQLRRALVFFSGAADVVYSSQHVARMSQNVHVPTSTLVRRLGLVFLVLFFVFLDLVFQIRRHISAAIEAAIHAPAPAHHGHGAPPAPEGLADKYLGTALGFAVWLAIYGSIYLALLLLAAAALPDQRAPAPARCSPTRRAIMERIHGAHVAELARWAADYGRSLDSAVELTAPPRRGAHRPLRPPPPAAHRRARR